MRTLYTQRHFNVSLYNKAFNKMKQDRVVKMLEYINIGYKDFKKN